jgi:hypothetical protein
MTANAGTDFWSGAGGPIVSAGLGLVGLPFQIASERRKQDLMASGLSAQLRAQNAALETNAMLGREGMYGQQAENLAARNFSQTAADSDLYRQAFAKNLELTQFDPIRLASATEQTRRGFDLSDSPTARKLRQEERLSRMKEIFGERQAQMAGIFGPIASQSFST